MTAASNCILLALLRAAIASADCTTLTSGQVRTAEWYVDNCLSPSTYDRDLWPTASVNAPTTVEIQLMLNQMGEVNEKLNQVKIGGYFRKKWKDARLKYNASAFPSGLVVKNYKPSDIIWIPDIYIDNLVESESGDSSIDYFNIEPDGSVYHSFEILWTIKCDLKLGKLPFDEQLCNVVAGSYSENESIVRVTAFGGTTGAGNSGIGVSAPPLSSTAWEIPGHDGEGFKTPGTVEVMCYGSPPPCWDFLHLTFSFKRKTAYYAYQVIVPDILFLGVSYTGFYIDAGVAPARATVAVIPLLIMLTLLNKVYDSLPPTSEKMWLTDYLLISLFFCSLAALQFAVVQLLLNREKKRAANLVMFKAVEKEAMALVTDSKTKGVSVLDLLSKYAIQEADMTAEENGTPTGSSILRRLSKSKSNQETPTPTVQRGRRRSPAAEEQGMTEADMSVIEYARDVFEYYDADGSGCLGPKEVRNVLAYFNIYLTEAGTATVICMFLRDVGETTPKDESTVEIKFGLFLELLVEVRKYLLKVSRHKGLMSHFKASPPSARLDMAFRILFPMLIILMIIGMLAAVPAY